MSTEMEKENLDREGLKVLIADDDELFLHIVEKLLKEEGFEVTKARTGEEALSLAVQMRPVLIILDSNMPYMSGEEVCRCLKQIVSMRRVPIIILSGLEDERSLKRFEESGCDDYFPKSMLVNDMAESLKGRVNKAIKTL